MAIGTHSLKGGLKKGSFAGSSAPAGGSGAGCKWNSQAYNLSYTGFQGSFTMDELYGVGALNIFGQLTDRENILSQVLGLDGNGMDPVRFNLLVAFWIITPNQLRYYPPQVGVSSKYDYSDIIFSAEQKNPFYRIECIELVKNESGTRWTSPGPCVKNLTGGTAATFPNLNLQGTKAAAVNK